MLAIDPAQRRALRAKAHHLHPVVSVGQHGLTPRVLHEIDLALAAHGLVKVRVHSDDRGEREAMLARIADELESAPVQHLGKLLILWRLPQESEPAKKPAKLAQAGARKPAKKRARRLGDKPVPRERQRQEERRSQPVGRRARGGSASIAPEAPAGAFEPASRRRRAEGAPSMPRTSKPSSGPPASRERSFGSKGGKPAAAMRDRTSTTSTRASSGPSAPNPRRRRRAP